jgi:hypothetical protein
MADMEDNDFVTDAEANNYINFAIAELHDLLIESYGSDYFLESITGTTTNGTSDYALPSNFYKLRGIDVKLNASDWINVNKFNFNERNRYEDFGAWTLLGISNIRYRIMGSNVKFTPAPDGSTEYRLWYIPVATKLTTDTDVLDDINQYSDFVIISAAMKMLNKEESDVSVLMSERNRLIRKIEESSQNRDVSEPEAISDVQAEINDAIWYTSRG